MTLEQAATDLLQTFRMTRRAKNIQTVGIQEDHKRIVVYTCTEEKQPWIFAYEGYPVIWKKMGQLKPC